MDQTVHSQKYTPYLALTGELWSVFCKYVAEKLWCHNELRLYVTSKSYKFLPFPSDKMFSVLVTPTPRPDDPSTALIEHVNA